MITEEEKQELVNEKAIKHLQSLMEVMEERYGEVEYEADLIGEMYAMMIAASMLGYYPVRMAKDAEKAAENIYKMVSNEGETNDSD
jgi:hypothetical protein